MGWNHIQGAGAQSSGGPINSLTASFGVAATIGNVIICRITNSSTVAESPVFQDGSNTYTVDAYLNPTSNTDQAGISHAIVATPVTTITLLYTDGTGNGYMSMAIDEYSFTGSLSVDGTGTLGVATTNSPVFGSALTVTGNDLVVAVLGVDGSSTVTAGSGFTLRYNENLSPGNAEGIAAEDALNVTSNTTPSWSLGSSVACYGAAVAYKATGGGGATPWLFLPNQSMSSFSDLGI